MVSKRLRNARKAAGLTQEAAARMANLERNTVTRYETGRRVPTLRCVMALAEVYGLPVAWFMEGMEGFELQDEYPKRDGVVEGLVFEGNARLAVKGTPVLYGQFQGVVGGMSMRFVGVSLVACVAESGWLQFDDTVVGMVPFAAAFFEEKDANPGDCNVVGVGPGTGAGACPAGSVLLVDRAQRELLDGKLYVLKVGEGVVARRVVDEGGWSFSEGSSGWKQISEVEEVIGRVRWMSHWLG